MRTPEDGFPYVLMHGLAAHVANCVFVNIAVVEALGVQQGVP